MLFFIVYTNSDKSDSTSEVAALSPKNRIFIPKISFFKSSSFFTRFIMKGISKDVTVGNVSVLMTD